MKWIVRLKRRNTIEDINNGAKGIFTIKSIIVSCKEEDIEKTIVKDPGFEIYNIQNWDLLQQIQLAKNIQYLFRQ